MSCVYFSCILSSPHYYSRYRLHFILSDQDWGKLVSFQKMCENVIFATKFNDECRLIGLDFGKSFSDFKHLVQSKWSELNSVHFKFSCSVGGYTKCVMDSDDDLRNVLMLCSHSSLKLVDTDVCLIQPSSNNQISSGSSNIDDNIQDLGFDLSIPCYDLCPKLDKKSYLSDHWSELFKGGVGSVFPGGSIGFKDALIKYATKMRFKFKFKRNDARYIYVFCNEDESQGCSWYVKASILDSTGEFSVYKANFIHKCVGKLGYEKSKIGPRTMSKLMLDNIKNDPNMGGKDVRLLLQSEYGIHVPYYKAWRTVESAKNKIFGRFEDSYDDLRWYFIAVERTNPGSVLALECNSDSQCFERMFISFKACIDGFQSCRPMLFLDGTFMKGRAQGVLLAATAKDANNGLFPVAFAVVSAENISNWEWFLEKLRDNIKHENEICYISDRNLGLMTAFNKVFEKPNHFFCLYHLLLNLRGRFSSGWSSNQRCNLGELFKQCAYAPNERLFNEKLEKFRSVGGQIADDFLSQLPVERWAVAYSPNVTRYGEMASNAAESLNSWLLEARSKPITLMIDHIRCHLAHWFVERRQKAEIFQGELVPTKQEEWDSLVEEGKSWRVFEYPGGDFLVESDISAAVNLKDKTCSCCKWQLYGFPCAHAVAVFMRHAVDVYSYVESYYFTHTYRDTYKSNLNPIPGTIRFDIQPDLDKHKKMLPPLLKRPPGRPKKQRIPSYGEYPKKKPKPSKCSEAVGVDSSFT